MINPGDRLAPRLRVVDRYPALLCFFACWDLRTATACDAISAAHWPLAISQTMALSRLNYLVSYALCLFVIAINIPLCAICLSL